MDTISSVIDKGDESPLRRNQNGNERVQMKKQLGLLEGVAIILGIIFGSGKLFKYLLLTSDGTLNVWVRL